jgi:hypothetical protein
VRKRRAAELVAIVSDCIRRHTQLQARLQEAGSTFRTEQDRQQFSGQAERAVVDLFGQLLRPTLTLTVAEARGPADAFFRSAAGLTLPRLTRLNSLVALLLAPPQEYGHLLDEVPEPDLVPAPDPDVFSDELWRYADMLLELENAPRRLSGLLAEARTIDRDLPLLVSLRVLYALSPEIGVAVRQGDAQVLLAVDDGSGLQDPEFGGADLLVGLIKLEQSAIAGDSAAEAVA